MFCTQNGPFKTLTFSTQIGSFQDPMNYLKHHLIDSFQDPHIGLYSVLISMGDYLQIDSTKSPWETSFNHKSSKPSTQWNLDLIFRQAEEDTSHAATWLISRPQDNTFCTRHSNILSKVTPFKTPEFTFSTVYSDIHQKWLFPRHRHRTRTPLQLISQHCTYSLVTLSSLRAHYIP